MIRSLSTWLVVALVGGAFVAGCGGSKSTPSSQSTPTAAPPTPTTATTTPTTATPSGAPAGLSVQQVVAGCKQYIQASPTIPASVKAKLLGICEKAASGNPVAARKAAREVCVELINVLHLPAGPAKEQALASCKKAK